MAGDAFGRVHVFTCDRATGSLRHKIRLDPKRHSPVTGIEFRTWCATPREAGEALASSG